MRLFPYQRASDADVAWGAWSACVDDSPPALLEDRVKGWDYESALHFSRDVGVRRDMVAASTNLPENISLDLVAIVDCPTSGERLVFKEHVPVEGGTVRMLLDVPAGLLAEAVVLKTSLVLGASHIPEKPYVACEKGQRLLDDRNRSVVLEGDGARFPTQALSFDAAGLQSALWSFSLDAASLESSVTSSMRLYINTDLKQSKKLSAGVDCSYVRFLEMNIARRVIGFAAGIVKADEGATGDWPFGSVGEMAQSLSEGTLGMSLEKCAQLLDRNPAEFDRILQNVFRPWEVK